MSEAAALVLACLLICRRCKNDSFVAAPVCSLDKLAAVPFCPLDELTAVPVSSLNNFVADSVCSLDNFVADPECSPDKIKSGQGCDLLLLLLVLFCTEKPVSDETEETSMLPGLILGAIVFRSSLTESDGPAEEEGIASTS